MPRAWRTAERTAAYKEVLEVSPGSFGKTLLIAKFEERGKKYMDDMGKIHSDLELIAYRLSVISGTAIERLDLLDSTLTRINHSLMCINVSIGEVATELHAARQPRPSFFRRLTFWIDTLLWNRRNERIDEKERTRVEHLYDPKLSDPPSCGRWE